MSTLKIEFENEKAAEHFTKWLSGQGEQDYWNWMHYREVEEEGDITARFIYHHPQNENFAQNDSKRYKNSKFCGPDGLTILTKCGRMTE